MEKKVNQILMLKSYQLPSCSALEDGPTSWYIYNLVWGIQLVS